MYGLQIPLVGDLFISRASNSGHTILSPIVCVKIRNGLLDKTKWLPLFLAPYPCKVIISSAS